MLESSQPSKRKRYTVSCERDGDEAVWAENQTLYQAVALYNKGEKLFAGIEKLQELQQQFEEEDPKAVSLQARITELENLMHPFGEGVSVVVTDPETKASWQYAGDGWDVLNEPDTGVPNG